MLIDFSNIIRFDELSSVFIHFSCSRCMHIAALASISITIIGFLVPQRQRPFERQGESSIAVEIVSSYPAELILFHSSPDYFSDLTHAKDLEKNGVIVYRGGDVKNRYTANIFFFVQHCCSSVSFNSAGIVLCLIFCCYSLNYTRILHTQTSAHANMERYSRSIDT